MEVTQLLSALTLSSEGKQLLELIQKFELECRARSLALKTPQPALTDPFQSVYIPPSPPTADTTPSSAAVRGFPFPEYFVAFMLFTRFGFLPSPAIAAEPAADPDGEAILTEKLPGQPYPLTLDRVVLWINQRVEAIDDKTGLGVWVRMWWWMGGGARGAGGGGYFFYLCALLVLYVCISMNCLSL